MNGPCFRIEYMTMLILLSLSCDPRLALRSIRFVAYIDHAVGQLHADCAPRPFSRYALACARDASSLYANMMRLLCARHKMQRYLRGCFTINFCATAPADLRRRSRRPNSILMVFRHEASRSISPICAGLHKDYDRW